MHRKLDSTNRKEVLSKNELAARLNSSYALVAQCQLILGRAATLAERELDEYEIMCGVKIDKNMRSKQFELFDEVVKLALYRNSVDEIAIKFGKNIPLPVRKITEVVAENVMRYVEEQILNYEFSSE
jgi:hypothetical protein